MYCIKKIFKIVCELDMKKINPVHLQYSCLIQKRLAIFHKGNNPFSFAVNVTNIAWLSTVCNYAYLLTVLA